MPHRRTLFRSFLLGPPDHPRFVIRDGRRLVDHFWTGRGWSRHREDARLFADPDDVNKRIASLTRRHLRGHIPKRLYLMTILVRVHADEQVSRGDVERYLRDALVIRVDHRRCGTGPTPDSLVEVVVPLISLDEGQ